MRENEQIVSPEATPSVFVARRDVRPYDSACA